MTILRVTWDNPSHLILNGAAPTVEVGGAVSGDTSLPGAHRFDLTGRSGNGVIRFRVAYGSHTMPLYLNQAITVSGNAVALGARDPRVTLDSSHASDGVFTVHIDTTFLDVTRAQYRTTGNDLHRGSFTFANGSSADLPLSGVLRLLSHTGGTPHIWAVYVSRAALAAPAANVPILLFYAPATGGRRDLEDHGHDLQLMRYLFNAGPNFGVTQRAPAGWWVDLQARGRYIQQIEASGKAVVYVHPFNTSGDFGSADSHGVVGLLRKMLIALRSPTYRRGSGTSVIEPGERVFAAEHATGVGRLAMMGFSHGARIAMSALRANSAAVHEAYLMDPPNAGELSGLSSWAGLAGRKVRLIAGDFLEGMRGSGLVPTNSDPLALDTGDRSLWPAGSAFFRRSQVYRKAFLGGTPPAPLLLAPLGGHSAISDASHFYVTPNTDEDHLSITALLADTNAPVVRELHGYANCEIATGLGIVGAWNAGNDVSGLPRRQLAFTNSLGTVTLPPRTEGDVDRALHGIRRFFANGYARRHQWPVYGGQAPSDDPAHFKGYLQLCLEHSGF
ncbi:MAG: hypothetical protein U0271_08025 [Polyangiaceae bacterium]